MAKSKIPDPLQRRHLIERELPPAQALKLADAYLEQGRTLEAVDFLRKAQATDRLATLRDEAVAAGEAFLLRVVATALGEPPDRVAWLCVAERAEEAGAGAHDTDWARKGGGGAG